MAGKAATGCEFEPSWMVSGADWSRWDTRRGPWRASWWSVGSVADWPSIAGRWIGSTRPTSTRSLPISAEMAVVMACFGRDWCCCGHTWSMSVQCPRITRRRGMWWVSWSIPICEWLLRERGLAATTVRRYQATARRFLPQRAGGVDLNDLTAAEVSRSCWHRLA